MISGIAILLLSVWLLQIDVSQGLLSSTRGRKHGFALNAFSSFGGFSWEALRNRVEEQRRHEILETTFGTDLTDMKLVGVTQIQTSSETTLQDCAVLASPDAANATSSSSTTSAPVFCVLVPLDPPQLKLLQVTAWNRTQSPWTLLTSLNPLLVNRDGALFDHLPWPTWTADPRGTRRDAAGQPPAARFSLGKREAFNRFLGQGWAASPPSAGGASWLAALQEAAAAAAAAAATRAPSPPSSASGADAPDAVERSQGVLLRRILELRYREAQMALAEVESNLAYATTQGQGDIDRLKEQREVAALVLKELQRQMQSTSPTSRTASAAVFHATATDTTKIFNDQDQFVEYRSPYDLLKEILQTQLQAEVIGAVLENTSLLQPTIGGALLLRRVPIEESVTIAGETVTIENATNDLGNPGITGGTLLVVECDADEAMGMAFACGLPLKIETDLINCATAVCRKSIDDETELINYRTALPFWKILDNGISILSEDQFFNESRTERVLAIRSPRQLTLYDAIFKSSSQRKAVFPVENPVRSLDQLDALSVSEKAQTLLSLSSFDSRLPRPRTVRERPDALDDLLIPLIDESVRRQYLIRDARRRGDMETLKRLESEKSQRQIAQENAARARDSGEDSVAEFWDTEAEFLESLRADPTQDEGSYSQWLDRDEWYERERQKMVNRLSKKKFGTLLDGMDL